MRIPIILLFLSVPGLPAGAQRLQVGSPNHRITVGLACKQGGEMGEWYLELSGMIPKISLGLVRSDQSFRDDLHFVKAGKHARIDDEYTTLHGKRSHCHNRAYEITILFEQF